MKRLALITEQLVRDLRADNTRMFTESGGAAAAAAGGCAPVNCLIVEDEENDAYLSLEAVKGVCGVNAQLARTGDEALQLLREAEQEFRPAFDIVFVDLRLQGSESQGADVIKQIRQKFPKTHTVIVSGTVNQEILDLLRGAYVGIVTKPLQAENLEEILAKHRMRKPSA